MARSESILQQVAAALERGALVLTSNQRAARMLHSSRRLQALPDATARVVAWSGWVQQLWTERIVDGTEERIPLNSQQLLPLLQQELAAVAPQATYSTAEMALGAVDLIGRWTLRTALRGARYDSTQDVKIFLQALERVDRSAAKNRWLPEAYVETELAQAQALPPVAELALVGFDSLTPAQQALLFRLEKDGAAVTHIQPLQPKTEPLLATCDSAAQQAQQCAAWCHALLQQQPEARIAIIAPDQNEVRTLLDRALMESFAQQTQHEFSLGLPLLRHAMVQTALLLLEWMATPLELEQVSSLLLSAYTDGPATRLLRGQADAVELRGIATDMHHRARSVPARLHLPWVASLLPPALNTLRQHWVAAFDHVQPYRGKRASYHTWADVFTQVLQLGGWPGTRGLSSEEFQLHRRWERLLDELAKLDVTAPHTTYEGALTMLRRMAAAVSFAPESHNAPIQIMGPLEAAGVEFDAIWCINMDDQRWPGKASPHPLLPYSLQRQAQMPGAVAAQHLQSIQEMHNRVLHSAPQVVCSYARHGARDEEMAASPLLAGAAAFELFAEEERASQPLELAASADESVVPLTVMRVRNGSTNLKLQSACSFRAFAELRLGATRPETLQEGLDARARGNLAHEVLQLFWQQTKTQHELKKISATANGESERTRLLRRLIHAQFPRSSNAWEKSYLALEEERLFRVLDEWLDYEMQRLPFTVEATEKTIEDVAVGPLQIGTLRIDRVDRVQVGDEEMRLLIDYKTGAPAPATAWMGDRPEEPQLPLYAIAGGMEDLHGIAFAQLRKAKGGYKMLGVATPPELVGSKTSKYTFADAEAEWRKQLTTLAEQFAQGGIQVNPKQPSTCQYCEQKLLCRIGESMLDDEVSDGDAGYGEDSEA